MIRLLVILSVVQLTFSLKRETTFYKFSKTSLYFEQTPSNCTDLNEVLAEAFEKNMNNHSLKLQLDEACYLLSSSSLATFSGWTDVAIVGKGVEVSNITCGVKVGFTFLSSFGITFRDVKILNCAQTQTSTSKNFSDTQGMSYLLFWVGIYFLSCGDITMDHVEVSSSNGVGVVMFNCNGTNIFNSSTFKLNFRDDDELARSGNVAIEFSFCQPGDVNCKDNEPPSFKVNQSNYIFYQCYFQYSTDVDFYQYNIPIVPYPHGTEHMAFGKGGGLSVIFKGRSSGNSVSIQNCTFSHNSAQWGSGLYTGFGDQSMNNSITIEECHFYYNAGSCLGTPGNWKQSGGAAQIDFIYYPADNELWPGYQPNVRGNSVRFRDTYFTNNQACWGGAVSIVISRESPGQPITNCIVFDKCYFYHNKASLAAAIDVSIFQPDLVGSNGVLMGLALKDCQFLQNGIDVDDFQVATGVVFANLVPLNFTGTNNFTSNNGTALVVYGTFVALSKSSEIVFHSNTGHNGGALAFYGASWLTMYKNTTLIFEKNSAIGMGGAIYATHFGEHDLMYKHTCFLQYYQAILHPSKWNVTIVFTRNLARNKRNSIFTTSLLPCVWPNIAFNSSFCGHPWHYDNEVSCTRQIWTGPSNIIQGEDSVTTVPGWKTRFNAYVLSDFGRKIPNVFSAVPFQSQAVIEVNKSTEYITDNLLIVHGVANTQAKVMLSTPEPKIISSLIVLDVKECPLGYQQQNCTQPNHEHMICDCICVDHITGIGYNNVTHEITVTHRTCLTYS